MSLVPVREVELIQTRMKELDALLERHFPELIHAWKAALAIVACGVIGNPYRCAALIFTGQASSGKSTVVESFFPPDVNCDYGSYMYRSDKFSVASFISHSTAAKSEEELKKIDLLPKLVNKTLLTSELAEMFKGNKNDLLPRFNILTRVLDGQGLTTDTGAWGSRGETGEAIFQWLGCTTPLETPVVAAMASLGPRLVFYYVDRQEPTAQDLVDGFKSEEAEGSESTPYDRVCLKVRELVCAIYQTYGRRSGHKETGVDRHSISVTNNEEITLKLMKWADIAAKLRMTIFEAKADPDNLTDEDPAERLSGKRKEFSNRIAQVFRQFSIGSAIAHGRTYLTDYEIKQIAHIALSTGMPGRTAVFEQAMRHGGQINVAGCRDYIDHKKNGIELRYMRELELAGLGEVVRGEGNSGSIFYVADEFMDLIPLMHPAIVSPKKKRKVQRAIHRPDGKKAVRGGDKPAPADSNDGTA